MANETERKFLISGDYKSQAYKSFRIKQGYLSSVKARSVRVRIGDDKAWLTIKGQSSADGLTRYEWEKEINPADAEELLQLCEPGIIDKTRHLVDYRGHIFEVDEFYGVNRGLVMAEIELSEPTEIFEKPTWLGREVTGDQRFYNSYLSKNPFSTWKI